MPPRPPILDSRALNDILRQLQHEARNDVPEWEPPPAGDAGTMLQRIFARLLEIVLQRLNQVPEKNLLAFLDTMGVSLLPPSPAQVPLTFVLTPGSPPTFVPQGTQASTQPSGQQLAVIFETADDLTVIPAQLTQGFTMEPTWDRYTDQTSVLGGQSSTGFTPFVGTRRLPHILYLGDDTLLKFRRAILQLEFNFDPIQELPDNKIREFLQGFSYQYLTQGTVRRIEPVLISGGNQQARFRLTIIEPIDQASIQGTGLTRPIQGRWLQASLTTPFPDDLVAQALRLHNLTVTVSAADLLPDLAFTNTALVDTTKDFTPLGEKPKVGDAFYFASDEVFGKEEGMVTLSIQLRPHVPAPVLVWEYLGSGGEFLPPVWRPVPSVSDGTNAFQQPASIQFGGLDIVTGIVNGETPPRYWIRVRVLSGSWSGFPRLTGFFLVRPGISPENIPPDAGFANDQRLHFSQPFLPFGERPWAESIFYFGFDHDPGLSITLKVDRVDMEPRASLTWEYLHENEWRPLAVPDSPIKHFIQSGTLTTLTFTSPVIPRQQVNGQEGRWVRVRLDDGDYGQEAEYIPVEPNDPAKGFKLRPGTGTFVAPVIQSFKISYSATKHPTIIRKTGFVYQELTPLNTQALFAPFMSISDPALTPHDESMPTLYLGFDAAFPELPVRLYLDIAPRAFAGSVIKSARAMPAPLSALPPLQWEYYNGTTWTALTVLDGTNNFTESDTVEFLTPTDIATLAKFDQTPRYWIRARSSKNDPFETQQLRGIFLNTIPAMQAETIQSETLDSSNGQPNQTLRIVRTPVLPGQQVIVREPEPPSDQERTAIEEEEGKDAVQERLDSVTGEAEVLVRWHEVANFVASDPHSRHYTLDHTSGLVTFGDGKHGLIPPPGPNNIIATYRTGGGRAGNVPKGIIAQVKSPLSGIGAVTNPVASDGGAEVETLPMVEDRGPQTLKHRDRAVAVGDFEWLARQAVGTRVARVKCLPNVNRDLHFEPGWVTLLVVPQGAEGRLAPSSELIREIEDSLEARAFVGLARSTPARLNVIGPGYIQVTVVAQVVPQDIDEAEAVKQQVRAALDAFLHPLRGGPNGTGWVFGRDVYESEVYKVIEDVPGVSHVKTLILRANLAQCRLIFLSAPRAVRTLPEHSLVRTNNRQKAALLAEPVPVGTPVDHIAVKGFTEGDRITKVLDLTTPRPSGTTIAVDAFVSDAAGFPRGSIVMTFDGRLRTRLAASISGSKGEIVVEDAAFASGLDATDVLTVFYPFAMTVRAVRVENGHQILTIDPYETNVAFPPATTVLATLDNCVRLPLHTEIQGNQLVTVITLRDFRPGEELFILPRGSGEAEGAIKLTIQAVEPVTHIVYLDDNFLVYPGVHRLTMVSDAEAAS